MAHKKQYELLPPEKKVRRVEIRSEQRHEHLTEEEKKIAAQIRSVAATLFEKVDLDKPTVEFLCEHSYKDPTLALAYFYCCATDPRVVSCMELHFKLDWESHWTRGSNALPRDILQP